MGRPLAAVLCAALLATGCGRSSEPTTKAEAKTPAPPTAVALPDIDLDDLDPETVAAIEAARRAVEAAPDAADRWSDLGILCQSHSRHQAALECYEQSLALRPNHGLTAYSLAVTAHRLELDDRAESAINQVLLIDRLYIPAYWRLGMWRLQWGDTEGGRSILEKAKGIAPGNRAVALLLARAHMQGGNGADAAAVLETHLGRKPDDRYAHFLLGSAYRQLGRLDDAERELALGEGAAPNFQDPWLERVMKSLTGYRADFLKALQTLRGADTQLAIERFEALRGRRPDDHNLLINLNLAYRKAGRVDDAIAVLEEVLENHPNYDLAHFHMAGVYFQKTAMAGDDADPAWIDKALRHADRTIELSPTFEAGYARRAEILQSLGPSAEAIELYRRAGELEPPPAIRWLDRAARLLIAEKRWEEAIPVLEEIVRRTPTNVEGMWLLGASQANGGRLEDAIATLERAVAIDPTNERVIMALEQANAALAEGTEGEQETEG